jgi:actin-related protein 5
VVFDNVVAKYKDKRSNSNMLSVGMDALCDAAAKSSCRSPFDGHIVCDFDRMETILDYIFLVLGISTSSVNHPIVMTEAVCNPQYSRRRKNEYKLKGL